jgi:hypothetical protein
MCITAAAAKPAPAAGPLAPSATAVLAARAPREILRQDGTEWRPLPATGPEAAAVVRLSGGRLLTGLQATEAELRKLLGR